jgi:hypothetical protein
MKLLSTHFNAYHINSNAAGSGKTYTMTAMYERLASTLFASSNPQRQSHQHDCGIRVSFFEISGDNCYDLFNHCNVVTMLKCNHNLHSSSSSSSSSSPAAVDTEYFEAYPVVEPRVYSAEDFMALVRYGTEARSTAATGMCAALAYTSTLVLY